MLPSVVNVEQKGLLADPVDVDQPQAEEVAVPRCTPSLGSFLFRLQYPYLDPFYLAYCQPDIIEIFPIALPWMHALPVDLFDGSFGRWVSGEVQMRNYLCRGADL